MSTTKSFGHMAASDAITIEEPKHGLDNVVLLWRQTGRGCRQPKRSLSDL